MWALLQVADAIHGLNCECLWDDPEHYNVDTCPYVKYLRQRQRTTQCPTHDS